jgi:4-hydroxy-3-methylbut-2-en-1-yl diphosphate reductase
VVFSAHGVSPAVRAAAEARGLMSIDATCPLVTKVHAEAIRYAKQGYQILLIGHRDHQEVIGTLGEAPKATQVVESPSDIPHLEIRDPSKLVYLTQTTLSTDDAAVIIRALKAAFPELKEPPSEDICYATTNRQAAVRQLSPRCDLVLVVGSRNSSNSIRLTEIAANAGTPGYLVDDYTECRPEWFEGVDGVLVTAGASAPEDLVEQLVLHLVDTHGATVEQHDVYREDVEFNLPVSLRRFMRSRGIDPSGRRIRMEYEAELSSALADRGTDLRVVDLTVGASEGRPA